MASETMSLTAIAAVDLRWCIGAGGEIPWHLPDDLKLFKQHTLDGVVIMGRKTHESIGRALPRRHNLILTRQPDYASPGCEVMTSVEQALSRARALDLPTFVIGGASIYEAFMPWTERCLLTVVEAEVEGDVFFPPLSASGWRVRAQEPHARDERHAHDFLVNTLERVHHEPWCATEDEARAHVPLAWRSPAITP